MNDLLTLNGLIGLLSLTLMEIVLGIDNIIFISILCNRLPRHHQQKARRIGLLLAMGVRILLLLAISWLIGLNRTLFSVFNFDITGRDLILLGGGLFLIYKSTTEIHHKIEGEEDEITGKKALTFSSAIIQIILLDIVFSFDSILTAIGLVNNVITMIIAVIISMLIMLASSESISKFINRHPTVKMLALAFLLMIGVLLVVEGFHGHVEKGYIYFAIFFSLIVELLNMRYRKKNQSKEISDRIQKTVEKD